VQWTVGILRHFRAFSTPEQNPALGVLSHPAPPPLTPTVSPSFQQEYQMANKAQSAPDKEVLLAEYHELAEGMRFHSDVRWKLLSVVIPVAGGLLALSFQFPNLKIPMNIFGLLTSSVFALIEYRTQLSRYQKEP
jgi:hypothetical protein